MTFLTDQDVYALTVTFLRDRGHDVATASDRSLSRAVDSELLSTANGEGRILITRDRDYGQLVFSRLLGSGVIYLRLQLSTIHAVHHELERVVNSISQDELLGSFVVVEPGQHRIRKPPIVKS